MIDLVDDTVGQPKLLNMTFFNSWKKHSTERKKEERYQTLVKKCSTSHSSPTVRANLKFFQVSASYDIVTLPRN